MTELAIAAIDAAYGALPDWAGMQRLTGDPQQWIPRLPAEAGLVLLAGPGVWRARSEVRGWQELRALLAAPRPVLCLGEAALLLAEATGGMVEAAELATASHSLTARRDAAQHDPVLAELPISPDVIRRVRPAVTELPPAAELLCASPWREHDAFRVGRAGYGFAFEFDDPELAEQSRAELAETWAPVVQRFAELAAGRRAGPRRDLPVV